MVLAHVFHDLGILVLEGPVESQVGYFVILSAPRGLAMPEMLEFEPAFDAEDSFLLQADVLEVRGMSLVAAIVFFKTHRYY